MKTLKNTPRSWILFNLWHFAVFLHSLDSPNQPRTSFLFYKFSYPTIAGRISDRGRSVIKKGQHDAHVVIE